MAAPHWYIGVALHCSRTKHLCLYFACYGTVPRGIGGVVVSSWVDVKVLSLQYRAVPLAILGRLGHVMQLLIVQIWHLNGLQEKVM